MITVVVVLLLSYLVGGIPWSLIVVRALRGIDLRQVGSGNLGASNVYRVLGAPGALGVLALDMLKGVVAPLGFARIAIDPPLFGQGVLALAAGIAAIAGHIFSPYLRFKGGKGIATTAGVFAALEPRACAVAFGVFLLGLALSRGIVSVGSLLAALVLPFAVWRSGQARDEINWLHTVAAALLALLIWAKHASNLERIIRGQEKSLFRRDPGSRAS